MRWISPLTGLRLPRCHHVALSAVAVACLLVGCVDTTPPWDKVAAAGGNADSSSAGGAAIDGLVAAGGNGGRAIDVGGPGNGDATGGGGAIDAPSGGAAGGMDASLGGAGGLDGGPAIDGSPPGTGGATAPLDAQTDGRLTGTGGVVGTGGNPRTGGATGQGGVGGKTGKGGTTGSGGTAARDAGPDLPPDLAPDRPQDLALDLPRDLAPDLPPDTSTLGTGLVAYYRFESASAATLADSSGHGRDGTLAIGAPPDGGTAPSGSAYGFATGKVGNALVLAKAGYGYVSLPPAVFANITDFTLAVWVNVTTLLNWQRVFDVGVHANLFDAPATGTKYMNLTPRNDKDPPVLRLSITSNGIVGEESLNTTPLSAGVWTHVAIVLTGGNGYLYIDGTQVDTDPTTLTPAGLGAIDYAYLGKSQFGADPYFDGMLDELRVYNRALSAAEIKAIFQLTGP